MTQRPASIRAFDKALFAGLAATLLATAVNWPAVVAMSRNPQLAALGVGPSLIVLSVALSLAIYVVLWFFIARRASSVAKWIFVVLTAITLLNFVQAVASPAARLGLTQLLGAIALVLQIYAAWLLFRPDARAWFASDGDAEPRGPVE